MWSKPDNDHIITVCLYTLNVNALSAGGKRASESLHKGISVAFTACITHSSTAISAIMLKKTRSKQKLGLYGRTLDSEQASM